MIKFTRKDKEIIKNWINDDHDSIRRIILSMTDNKDIDKISLSLNTNGNSVGIYCTSNNVKNRILRLFELLSYLNRINIIEIKNSLVLKPVLELFNDKRIEPNTYIYSQFNYDEGYAVYFDTTDELISMAYGDNSYNLIYAYLNNLAVINYEKLQQFINNGYITTDELSIRYTKKQISISRWSLFIAVFISIITLLTTIWFIIFYTSTVRLDEYQFKTLEQNTLNKTIVLDTNQFNTLNNRIDSIDNTIIKIQIE